MEGKEGGREGHQVRGRQSFEGGRALPSPISQAVYSEGVPSCRSVWVKAVQGGRVPSQEVSPHRCQPFPAQGLSRPDQGKQPLRLEASGRGTRPQLRSLAELSRLRCSFSSTQTPRDQLVSVVCDFEGGCFKSVHHFREEWHCNSICLPIHAHSMSLLF